MRCPVCRAQVEQGPQCRRCRADLSLLLNLEEQQQRVLALARHLASRGQWQRALALAEGADTLRSDEDSRRLIMLCHLGRRDFGRAWRMYANCCGQNSEN